MRSVAFRRLKNSVCDLIFQEEGQGITEYVLILGFSITLAVLFARGLKTAIERGILVLGGELEKDLKTGRTQLGAWKN
ncbi:MAG: hypothetical protein ACK5QT_10420 [Oligoflexia bacterium]|jgi:hypothetical protein